MRVTTEFLLIRHGETDMNREQRFQGQIDVPLNVRGHLQAQRLAERLLGEPLDAFYCSDLTRARQTASPAEAQLRVAATPLPALREQGFGILEGLAFPEVVARYPEEFEAWRRHDPDYALPGGESVRAFHARVMDAVLDLAQRHAGQRLALVTHGGVLDMLWRTAQALPLHGPRACAIPNAGLNRIRVRGARLEIVLWADDAHVAEIAA